MSRIMSGGSLGVDVCLESLDDKDNPHCPHGPTLLFQRYQASRSEGSARVAGQRFYACSACRDRKNCSFFQLEDDKISEARKQAREQQNKALQPAYAHKELFKRRKSVKKLPQSERKFCQKCGYFLLPNEWSEHAPHPVAEQVTDEQLTIPSLLLSPLENKKSNAQYLFSEKAVKFMLGCIQDLGFTRVLCVGAPSLHEAIMKRQNVGQASALQSLLLDIDFRFGQFYNQKSFCRYNMFNHHFFEGEPSETVFRDFVGGEGSESVVMVMDPPFGGLVDVLAHTVKKVTTLWKQNRTESLPGESAAMPVMWIFPYFMEPRIQNSLPSFTMLDYKVDYDNHLVFKTGQGSSGKASKHGSPVRIFTNIPPEKVKLPKSEGYRFCSKCKRYVSTENKHCAKCDACTSKDGKTYVHCDLCGRCVKPSRVHCETCGQCQLPQHTCGQTQTAGCHICGDLTHKRRECPNRGQQQGLKRKAEGHQNPKHKQKKMKRMQKKKGKK